MAYKTRSCKPEFNVGFWVFFFFEWGGGGVRVCYCIWCAFIGAKHWYSVLIFLHSPSLYKQFTFYSASRLPTYGELMENSEKDAPSDYDALYSVFQQQYPHVKISRPKRFYDAVNRIAAPTKPSSKGDSKLCGSPLATYRKRVWKPRVRNTLGMEL